MQVPGITMPRGYAFDARSGKVVNIENWPKEWFIAAGTLATLGYAAGAFTPAAAGGGAAGSMGTSLANATPAVAAVPAAAVPAATTALTTGEKVADAVSNAIPPVAGLVGGAGDSKDLSPEAQALIDQQRLRMEQSNPLYQDVMQLAFNRMPTASRDGLTVPSFDEVSASVPQVGEGDYAEDPATRGLLRQQLIRSKMSDPVLQAVLRLARSRMPNRGGA